jgi:hypothetical protein
MLLSITLFSIIIMLNKDNEVLDYKIEIKINSFIKKYLHLNKESRKKKFNYINNNSKKKSYWLSN